MNHLMNNPMQVSRSDFSVTSELAEKPRKFVQHAEGGVTCAEVGEGDQKRAALSDEEAVTIARLLVSLEEEFGKPQDFEWGMEGGGFGWGEGGGEGLGSGGEGEEEGGGGGRRGEGGEKVLEEGEGGEGGGVGIRDGMRGVEVACSLFFCKLFHTYMYVGMYTLSHCVIVCLSPRTQHQVSCTVSRHAPLSPSPPPASLITPSQGMWPRYGTTPTL